MCSKSSTHRASRGASRGASSSLTWRTTSRAAGRRAGAPPYAWARRHIAIGRERYDGAEDRLPPPMTVTARQRERATSCERSPAAECVTPHARRRVRDCGSPDGRDVKAGYIDQLLRVALRLLREVHLEIRPQRPHVEVAAPRLVLAHEYEPGRHRGDLVPVRDEVRGADPRPARPLPQLPDVAEVSLVVAAQTDTAANGVPPRTALATGEWRYERTGMPGVDDRQVGDPKTTRS